MQLLSFGCMCAEKSEKMQKHKEKSDKNIANIRK